MRKGEDGYLRVDYSSLEMMLLEAVKKLKARNDGQQAQIEALQAELKKLGGEIASWVKRAYVLT